MIVYRFRCQKKWYAYALMSDAQSARDYFVNLYGEAAVEQVEETEEKDFQFKLNSVSGSSTYR